MAMLTMLLPTRIVTSSRWGSDLSPLTVSAFGTPSSTIDSTRCCGSEKKAISEEEKNAESPISKAIASTPRAVMVVLLRAGSWSTSLARNMPTSDKPIITDRSSAPELSVVLDT
jgi:hypothetical protein